MKRVPTLEAPPSGHAHAIEGEQNRCPTCNQEISPEQFEEIRARIEAQDRQHARDVEERVAGERAGAEAKAAAQVAAVEQVAAAQVASIKEATVNQLKEAEQTKVIELATAREAATKAANEVAEAKLTEADEKTKAAAVELETLKKSWDEMLNQRLTEQREALEEDKVKSVNEANAEAFREKQKVEAQVAKLTRQLQQKSSDELGEGAEIDLFETLKAEFPQDKITRIKKGAPGADVRHEVMDGQTSCGLIVYDSKNRKAWRNDYVEKLRTDQIAAKATHALLSTHVFPSGASQFHLQDGVIVVNPARAVAVATLLRQQMIHMHAQRLGDEEREEKTALVYRFITSDLFSQLMQRIDDYADDLLELDVKEKSAHEHTWTKRGALVKSLQRAQGQLVSEIDRIVGEDSSDEAAAG